MAVDIKQASRRIAEDVFGKGKLEVLDEICDPGLRSHDPFSGDSDLRELKESVTMYRTAFPDFNCAVLAQYLDGDTCITQWRATGTHRKAFMGIEPTGARSSVEGITIDRYRGGKLVESWSQWDGLTLLRQLGVAPQLGAGAPGARVEPRHHA